MAPGKNVHRLLVRHRSSVKKRLLVPACLASRHCGHLSQHAAQHATEPARLSQHASQHATELARLTLASNAARNAATSESSTSTYHAITDAARKPTHPVCLGLGAGTGRHRYVIPLPAHQDVTQYAYWTCPACQAERRSQHEPNYFSTAATAKR